MVTHWTALLILIHALTAETITITEVDEFLEALGRAGAGQSWDYTLLFQLNSNAGYNLVDQIHLTQKVCGDLRVRKCNPVLKLASFVCAYTWEENLQHGSLQEFLVTWKYKGCSILEYIAAFMLAYAGEVVKGVCETDQRLGSILKNYGGNCITYHLYQDMYPIVCRRVNPGHDQLPAGADTGLIATACNYLRRADLQYLVSMTSQALQASARKSLPQKYLPDKVNLSVTYETVGMMSPQLCGQYPALQGCTAIIEQVTILVAKVAEIQRKTVGWQMNRAVDEYDRSRCFRLHHARHFIPFAVCQGEARRTLSQCRYLLEDRLEVLIPTLARGE